MTVYEEKNYGCDADGNRGVAMVSVELEDTEEENRDIAEILYSRGYSSEEASEGGSIYVEYEGYEVEVYLSEYTEYLKALEDADDLLSA